MSELAIVTEEPKAESLADAEPSKRTIPDSLPLLLEVGCEEIPARFLRDAEGGLGERVFAALESARLLPEACRAPRKAPKAERRFETYSTPRRLVVHVPAVRTQQPDKVEEILGPPVKVSVDAEGKFTRAAESFAQKNAASLDDLIRTTTPKGEYLSIRKTVKGEAARQVLAQILPPAILGLTFPKSMYWRSKSDPRFVRPIRWIVAILGAGKDAATVPFEVLGVNSNNFTFGHRAKGSKPVVVTGFMNYSRKLAQDNVEIDYLKRITRIVEDARTVLGEGQVVPDEWLVDWIANATEWPRPILGSFDERFLHLPREILTTVMRDHQRYFAVEKPGAGGAQPEAHRELAPHFIAVLNMPSDAQGLIRQGHERVLTARFRDAEFFWAADQKIPVRDRVPLLDKVTYQAKLGSYGDKIRRMSAFAVRFCVLLEKSERLKPDQTAAVLRAVELSKCDLTTQMVQEFTELQGVVGGLYARAQGEPEEIATAIYDHYLPLGVEGAGPRTLAGALVSLTDKVDTVVGGFTAGLEPTGSRDPFALRRAGNGIVKVLIEFGIEITFSQIIAESLATFAQPAQDGQQAAMVAFLEERLNFYLETVTGCRHDTVRAVLAVSGGTPLDALERAQAVEKIRDTDDYIALAAAAKRTRNILRKSAAEEEFAQGTLNPALFQEEPEVELHKAYESIFQAASGEGDYGTLLSLTARLRPYIDKFFDKVLVMHSDPSIRKNRLLLLHLLDTQVFSRVADLSEIEGHVDAPTLAR
jgi:glycyl-tRNA synthetase beta chain